MNKMRHIQEAPIIFACSNIDYLRSGSFKFKDKSLTLCDQEEAQPCHFTIEAKVLMENLNPNIAFSLLGFEGVFIRDTRQY
jgi:hypothetical protein